MSSDQFDGFHLEFSNSTGVPSNTTTPTIDTKIPVLYGYIAVIIAVIFFGSNFLPVKKFSTGNGVFFQWMLCSGIWVVGFVVNAIRSFPIYHPLAMVGGFLWCTGNMMAVPIINTVGLAKGILLWGSFNLLMGWASSRFGWFGINAQKPTNQVMNYVGVALCLTSACIYLFMKSSGNDAKDEQPIEVEIEAQGKDIKTDSGNEDEHSKKMKKKQMLKTIAGSLMAVCAGCFFGLTFVPVVYKKDRDPEASSNGLDYVFAHFTGIFLTSTTYFLIYCAIKKNNPDINPKIALPGFISGLMWGVASVAWFVANDALSESISFPIITTLPGIVGTFWGLLFREIRGWKNYLVLFVAIGIGIAGSITTGFSK